MRVKIAEKRLFSGVALLVVSLLLFFYATLITTPVRISEKGMALLLIAVVSFILAIRLIGKCKIGV